MAPAKGRQAMSEGRSALTEWDVSVDFAPFAGEEFDPRIGDGLLDATEKYEGVVSVLPRRITIAVTLAAPGYWEAVGFSGVSAAQDALRAARCRDDLPVERVEAKTAERAERDLEEPTFPEMFGVSEVAKFLGVSKQRVSELREAGRLPEPLSELRAGPVWPRPTIERFLERWARRPGRPPADSRIDMMVREGSRTYLIEVKKSTKRGGMAHSKKTGKKAASAASKVLRDGRTSKTSKSAAGSALGQRHGSRGGKRK